MTSEDDDPEFAEALAVMELIGAVLRRHPPTVQATVLTGLVGRFIASHGKPRQQDLQRRFVEALETYLATAETRQ